MADVERLNPIFSLLNESRKKTDNKIFENKVYLLIWTKNKNEHGNHLENFFCTKGKQNELEKKNEVFIKFHFSINHPVSIELMTKDLKQ